MNFYSGKCNDVQIAMFFMQPIQIECFTTWAASTTVGPDLFTRGSAIGTASLLKQKQ